MRTQNADLEIKRAAQLAITEISLGSVGHAFNIPLVGHVLSLNQLAFMLNALNHDQLIISSVFEISCISAVLKSFSPAGAKLGPMLSIAMQGFLFWICCAITRAHLIGQLVGAALMALWAFVQPLITYGIIFGLSFTSATSFYETHMKKDYSFWAQSILVAVISVVVVKMVLAMGLVFYSYMTKKNMQFVSKPPSFNLSLAGQADRQLTPARGAFKDMMRPLFIISFILMTIFVWQFETTWSERIWFALRPLAIAFIIFYALRSPWIAGSILKLTKKSRFVERIYLKSKAAFNLVAEGSTRSSEISSGRKSE